MPLRSRLFLAGAAALYAPWLFLGYGADSDIWSLLHAGRVLLTEGTYVGSRNPGYLIPEVGLGLLDLLGGSVLSNAGTLVMGLVAVGSFLTITDRLAIPHRFLLATGLVLHPVFWTNATSSMDHVWALGFLLSGWLALLDRRWLLAGLLLGCAVGSRLTLVIAVAAVLGYAVLTDAARRDAVRAGLVAGVLGAACYLPPAAYAGWTMAFLQPGGLGGPELWTWPMRLGRWGYKSLYLWGLPTAALLAGFVAYGLRKRPHPRTALLSLCAFVVVAYEALFLRFPLDVGYLLPIVPFVLIALGLVLARHRPWLTAFVVLLGLYNVVTINVARPDRPFEASGASFGLWVEPGPLIEHTRLRLLTRDCEDSACWQERMGRTEP